MGPSLLRELALWQNKTGVRQIESVFFGGGTPSLMPPALIESLLAAANKPPWHISAGAEITLEANPEHVSAKSLKNWREAGINRLSLGVQALEDKALQKLGRRHRAAEAKKALALAQEQNWHFSFDLIYGRPGQTRTGWRKELREALALAGEHLSLYLLEWEEGTAFAAAAKAGKLSPLPDDETADFYQQTGEQAQQAGFSAYEISNHAKGGAVSRHNLYCWRGGDYLGLGPGAHGRITLAKDRFSCEAIKSPRHWLAALAEHKIGHARPPVKLTKQARLEETLLMGLRLAEGVPLASEGQSGFMFAEEVLAFLTRAGLLRRDENRLCATQQGWLVLDALLPSLCERMQWG